MIFTDLGPNEAWSDAWLSLKLLFQPWRWYRNKSLLKLKKQILKKFLKTSDSRLYFLPFFSGRSALYFLLKSLNLKDGDEVLVQGFTCEAVVLPIKALKLKPIYVDIETNTFSIDPIDLKKKLSKKAKVIILQHSFGIWPSQRKQIINLIRKHNLVLIEDIAHGLTNYRLKILNSNHFLLFSFGRSKTFSSVFGGAVVGINKKVKKQINRLNLAYPTYSLIVKLLLYKPIVMLVKSTYNFYIGRLIHFFARKFNLLINEVTKAEKKGNYNSFFNLAYPNVLAILLNHQLKSFKKTQNQRKKIVNYYLKSLAIFINKPEIYYNQPLIRFPLLIKNRDKILKNLAKKGIFLGRWYDQPIAPKGLPLNKVGYKLGFCPTAEKVCQQIINLPTNINHDQAKRIVKYLNKLLV